MPSEQQKPKPPKKARIWILIGLCIFAGLLWAANWYFVTKHVGDEAKQGQFGDMFGAVNALFTALAFAGLIYTVLLQRDQLALQQQEIVESGKAQEILVQRQIDAQKTLFEQQKFHEIKLEELRQKFEEIVEGRRKDRETQNRNEFANNVARAIRCELEALALLYQKGIGDRLVNKKEGDILRVRFVLTEKWMTVFDANTVHLGSIDADLARKIISVYALLKGLIEEYRINNEYLTELERLNTAHRQNSTDEVIRQRLDILIDQMRGQAQDVTNADTALKAAFSELIRDMDAKGIR